MAFNNTPNQSAAGGRKRAVAKGKRTKLKRSAKVAKTKRGQRGNVKGKGGG